METTRKAETRNETNYHGTDLRDVACFRDYASDETLRAMLRQPTYIRADAESRYEGNWAKQVIAKVTDYSRKHTQELPYHNFNHENDVAEVCDRIAEKLKLPARERFILHAAGKTHDLIVILGAKNNEVKTARRVNDLLITPEYNVAHTDAEEIGRTIVQTEVPQKPYTTLGEILCDADLANFGRTDFFEKSDLVRQELGINSGKGWYASCLNLLKNHKYHTQAARDMFDEQKARNIQKLEEMLGRAEC